jgi:hypothetical protein
MFRNDGRSCRHGPLKAHKSGKVPSWKYRFLLSSANISERGKNQFTRNKRHSTPMGAQTIYHTDFPPLRQAILEV